MNDIINLIALLVGAWTFVFIFLQLSPKIELRILPRWLDSESDRFILRLEIENTSRVRVKRKLVLLQILQYSKTRQLRLSEWVPFSEKDIQEDEEPVQCTNPIKVFESTEYLYPGEKVIAERLEYLPHPHQFLHIGFQFQAREGWLFSEVFFKSERWTTTAIIFR